MKTATAILSLLTLSGVASAQSPDPSKWMCRNLADSGGYVYQGESVFGTQACRPIPQAAVAPSAPVDASNAAAKQDAPDASATASPAISAPPAAAATPAAGFLLEDGTPVHLVLSENLSSADAVTGQTVEFEVVDDVIVNGFVVVPHGATAWATVTDAEHKRRMGRAGKLDLNIDKVRLADGEKALLRAVKDTKGGGHTGAMVGAMVATSLVVWPAAPLFLLMHGKDVTIPKGTNITAFVQGDVTLDQSKFPRQLVVAR
ncbi:MAG: hypothetical protein WB630_25140 [Candidatus Acidiferrales bacterium]